MNFFKPESKKRQNNKNLDYKLVDWIIDDQQAFQVV